MNGFEFKRLIEMTLFLNMREDGNNTAMCSRFMLNMTFTRNKSAPSNTVMKFQINFMTQGRLLIEHFL